MRIESTLGFLHTLKAKKRQSRVQYAYAKDVLGRQNPLVVSLTYRGQQWHVGLVVQALCALEITPTSFGTFGLENETIFSLTTRQYDLFT